jgi:hypothetical protein
MAPLPAVFIRALVLLALAEQQPVVFRDLNERRLSGGGESAVSGRNGRKADLRPA